MGGWGSNRWNTHSKKSTIEDGLSLSISNFDKLGFLNLNGGRLTWTNTRTGEKIGEVGYSVQPPSNDQLRIFLEYSKIKQGTTENISEPIDIITSVPYFGGLRYWFKCPLVLNGSPCNRRVGKIYLPHGAKYFGCRHCFNLAYRSAQTHEKRFDFLTRLMKGKSRRLEVEEEIERMAKILNPIR